MRADPRESHVIEYGWRRFIVTTAIIIATLLEIVDVTIVNVALPNIEGNFGASIDQAAWIGTGYLIANVIVIPITPWLQIRFGRKQYYFASIVLFTFSSLMCGLSGSLTELVVWRIVQGLGGGGLISTSQAILRETFPLNEQGKAAGIFAMGVIVGPTLGPTLGGIITDNLSWRWAFFVNLPLGILAATLVWAFLRNPAPARRIPLDRIGLVLLAVGIGSLQYVLDQGQRKDWFGDDSIVACSIIAAFGLVTFILWELYGTRIPVVNLKILRYRSVAAGSALGMVLGISLYGSVLVLPQFVQGLLGFTATDSGELLVMRAGAVLVLTPIVANLAMRGKVDMRVLVGFGFLILGISNIFMAHITTTDAGFWTFLLPLALSGIGLAQIFVPLSLLVLSSVDIKDVPAASAFFNLSRQVGGSIAIAVLVTIIGRGAAAHQTALAATVNESRPPIAHFLAEHGGERSENAIEQLTRMVENQALALAYADTARVTAVITLALCPLVVLMGRPRGLESAAAVAE